MFMKRPQTKFHADVMSDSKVSRSKTSQDLSLGQNFLQPVMQWDRNLRDRGFVKISRPRTEIRDHDRNFKICEFFQNFLKKCCHQFQV